VKQFCSNKIADFFAANKPACGGQGLPAVVSFLQAMLCDIACCGNGIVKVCLCFILPRILQKTLHTISGFGILMPEIFQTFI